MQDPFDPGILSDIRLRMEAPGQDLIQREFRFEPATDLSIDEVPTGSKWVLTLEGLTEFGAVRSRGRTLPFSIGDGDTSVDVFVGLVGQFSFACETLGSARASHVTETLPDGRLLMVGGTTGIERNVNGLAAPIDATAAIEVFDPGAGNFTDRAEADCMSSDDLCLAEPRAFSTASSLEDGRVILIGGSNGGAALRSSEFFETDRGTLRDGPTLTAARSHHSSFALNGQVIAAGGIGDEGAVRPDAELFEDGTFQLLQMSAARFGAASAPLPDGLLVVGGIPTRRALQEAGVVGSELAVSLRGDRLLQAGGSKFFATGGEMCEARAFHTATPLPDGRVLIVGGLVPLSIESCSELDACGPADATATVEIFDPESDQFAPVGSLAFARWGHTTTLLEDGTLLVVGGYGGSQVGVAVRQVELLDPSGIGSIEDFEDSCDTTDRGLAAESPNNITEPRAFHTTTLAENGSIVVAGGVDSDGNAMETIEVFVP